MTDIERLKRMTVAESRSRGTRDWTRGRMMFNRFMSHLPLSMKREWRDVDIQEQIAWRELAKMYRACLW